MNEELLEKTADFLHDQWSHWMKYLFSLASSTYIKDQKIVNKGVGKIIFPLQVERWQRQMNTPYSELSEKEKDSDREWARKLMELIDDYYTKNDPLFRQFFAEQMNKSLLDKDDEDE